MLRFACCAFDPVGAPPDFKPLQPHIVRLRSGVSLRRDPHDR